ncbi:MAG: flagellar hook capping FlgD N-terminal domain-containing protein [Pseudomonadota bacterium]
MIPPTSQIGQSPLANTGGGGSSSALASDFDTFLKMLTAQARYQDPLQPIDSSEYAAQLAQFSMVEQQVMSNDLLTALATQIGTGNVAQMASWIGMEARTTAPVSFDGSTPVTLYPNPVAASDEVVLVVYDEDGTEVQRQSIPVSADPVEWAGIDDEGNAFPEGTYTFEIESRANGEVLLTDPAESFAVITETRMQGGQTVLILENGTAVLPAAVSALRQPGSGTGGDTTTAASAAYLSQRIY